MPQPAPRISRWVYHVVNRGDRREEIFRDDPDREPFLSTLTEACGKTRWQVHAHRHMSDESKAVERGLVPGKRGLPAGTVGSSVCLVAIPSSAFAGLLRRQR